MKVFRSTGASVGAVISFAVVAQNANPVGDWALVSLAFVNVDTGEETRPWGANPVGQLTYSANGRMIAVLTADPKVRKPVDFSGGKSTEERAALYSNSSAYSGTWSAVANTVTHKVDIAVNQSWVGTDQVRYTRLDKDDLTIETAPILSNIDGKTKNKLTLVWKRVK
jgi:Lipocalin-like domain